MDFVAWLKSFYLTTVARGAELVTAGQLFSVDTSTPADAFAIVGLLQSLRCYPASYPETVEVFVHANFAVRLPHGIGRVSAKKGDRVELPRMAAVWCVSHNFARPVNAKLWSFYLPTEDPAEVRKLYTGDAGKEKNWVTNWRK